MKVSDAFPSNYLKASDLNNRPRICTVHNVELKDVGGEGKEQDWKPVMEFLGSNTNDLILNKTNASTLASAWGDDTDDWLSKRIEVRPEKTDVRGQLVDCIRVHPYQQPIDDELPDKC